MKRHVSELRPTQFAIGMLEVDAKIRKLQEMKASEVDEYLDAHPVPIVLCCNGEAHLIDHHHLVRACWDFGIEKVVTEVKADLSHVKEGHFWEEMKRLKWTHLFDQFGGGPHGPELLPMTVRGLADDGYRSLAWALRERGAILKSPEPFFEFKWADYLRKRLPIDRTTTGFKKALEEALKLVKHPEASHLPGYLSTHPKHDKPESE